MAKKPFSLFICGYCGKDTKGMKAEARKVHGSKYSNILCYECEQEFWEAIEVVERCYLRKA